MNAEQARWTSMAWIRDWIEPDDPDVVHIVIGIDLSEKAGPGHREVSDRLGYGVEGDEGVFYLLPGDLCAEVTRSGDVVTVDLLTPGDEDGDGADWVTLLTAAIDLPASEELPGFPIVLIEHEGVAGLDELLATIPESGVHIIGPKPEQ